ncbi:MAG: hypothetical protein R3C45_06935 [Phycisphaerales bacterium]
MKFTLPWQLRHARPWWSASSICPVIPCTNAGGTSCCDWWWRWSHV